MAAVMVCWVLTGPTLLWACRSCQSRRQLPYILPILGARVSQLEEGRGSPACDIMLATAVHGPDSRRVLFAFVKPIMQSKLGANTAFECFNINTMWCAVLLYFSVLHLTCIHGYVLFWHGHTETFACML